MQIEERALDSIRPYDHNPRVNDAAVDAVAESIREFGFRQPIVVDDEGVIIVGHTRYKAAHEAGAEDGAGPCGHGPDAGADQGLPHRRQQDGLAGRLGLRTAAHRIGRAEGHGFRPGPARLRPGRTGQAARSRRPGRPDRSRRGSAPPDEAITQPGDLWILGDHRLLCGDSSKPEDVDRLLDGATIHLVNTDPPYNVKVEPRSNNAIAAGLSSFEATHHQKLDVARHPEKAQAHRQEAPAQGPAAGQRLRVRRGIRPAAARLVRQHGPRAAPWPDGFYIWGGYANCGNYPPVLKACGLYFSQAIIWDKEHPVLTRKDFMGDA